MKGYRYYILNRPVSIGTQPMRGFVSFENYDQRTFIPQIGREAWGSILYDRELTDKEVREYELAKGWGHG